MPFAKQQQRELLIPWPSYKYTLLLASGNRVLVETKYWLYVTLNKRIENDTQNDKGQIQLIFLFTETVRVEFHDTLRKHTLNMGKGPTVECILYVKKDPG